MSDEETFRSLRILVTGSSGYLGSALVRRLRREHHDVFGIDPVPANTTDIVGSITDRELVRAVLRRHGVEAIVHTGALHKPHIATHTEAMFESVNVTGTLNLLAEAVEPGSAVDRFVFTSTTSLMISDDLHSGRLPAAAWITEEFAPLAPRNVYGTTKLAAEQLCRRFHNTHGLPVVVLRTSRFFPEEDDMAHTYTQSNPNIKANEYLFRRISRSDAVDSHLFALARARALGFDTFIISATTPFTPEDCPALLHDAPAVVARYHPEYAAIYARLGWTMFSRIDRVYVSRRAADVLGFRPRTNFAEILEDIARRG